MLHIATETHAHTHVNVTSFVGNFKPGEVAETSPNQGSKHTRFLPSRLRQSELEPTLPATHASPTLVRRMLTPSCEVHHPRFAPGPQGMEPGVSHYAFFYALFALSLRHMLFLCLLLLQLSPHLSPRVHARRVRVHRPGGPCLVAARTSGLAQDGADQCKLNPSNPQV